MEVFADIPAHDARITTPHLVAESSVALNIAAE
jgi:hypothetical protein